MLGCGGIDLIWNSTAVELETLAFPLDFFFFFLDFQFMNFKFDSKSTSTQSS